MAEAKVTVLDHGYVQLVESWGSDKRIVEAARMSTDKGFVSWNPYVRCKYCGVYWFLYEQSMGLSSGGVSCKKCEPAPANDKTVFEKFPRGDMGLLSYLWEHKHHTPFEMCGLTIEVQCPIFVIREWHRHRVPFGYNELSARYTPMPDVNYIPNIERCMVSSATNKQAGTIKGAAALTSETAYDWIMALDKLYAHAQQVYQLGLNVGIPKEVARLPVPVGRYTRMRATGNLRGWLAFLTLRMDAAAQWEIRQFAVAVGELIATQFPRTWRLFNDKS